MRQSTNKLLPNTENSLSDHFLKIYQRTLFPELVEILGYSTAIKLINSLGGRSIYIPSQSDLSIILRDHDIFTSLFGKTGETAKKMRSKMSNKYNIRVNEVRAVFRMQREVSENPMKSRGGRTRNEIKQLARDIRDCGYNLRDLTVKKYKRLT